MLAAFRDQPCAEADFTHESTMRSFGPISYLFLAVMSQLELAALCSNARYSWNVSRGVDQSPSFPRRRPVTEGNERSR